MTGLNCKGYKSFLPSLKMGHFLCAVVMGALSMLVRNGLISVPGHFSFAKSSHEISLIGIRTQVRSSCNPQTHPCLPNHRFSSFIASFYFKISNIKSRINSEHVRGKNTCCCMEEKNKLGIPSWWKKHFFKKARSSNFGGQNLSFL